MSLQCLHFCTSASWGGLELYACTLMVELQKAGCSVTAVCLPNSRVEAYLVENGIRTIRLPSYAVVSIRSIVKMRKLIQEEHIDAVHVHFHKDVWIASLALRNQSTTKLFLSIYMGVPKKNDPLHRFIYQRVDAILTSSEELNSRLPDLYPVPKSKIHFLPYGRSLELYTRDEAERMRIRDLYGVGEEDVLVGTMVRIDPGKGVMDFARSFSYIDPRWKSTVKYLIVGEPTRKGAVKAGESPFEPHCEVYQNNLETFIASENLGGKILLAGFQEDLVGYLSALDIFVFPSRDELYSLVVLDAMCMGLPIVAARAGGNLYQIEDGITGFLYTVTDSEDLARTLTNYIVDPDLRKSHGLAARRRVSDRHDMKRTIDQLLASYTNRN